MLGRFGSAIAGGCTNRSFRSQCRYWLVTLVAVAGYVSHAAGKRSPASAQPLRWREARVYIDGDRQRLYRDLSGPGKRERSPTVFVSALQLSRDHFASDIGTPEC